MKEARTILIRGGQVIDPANGIDRQANLLIQAGQIAALTDEDVPADRVLDASGRIVAPGLIDAHVHLREPGQEHKEDIASGTAAARAGGFSAVACMPNTTPPIDTPETIRHILNSAQRSGHCSVYPIACLSRQRQGDRLVDFAALTQAGAVAFSDDGDGLTNDDLMADAFSQLKELDMVAIQHCESAAYERGVIHLGTVSRELGLPGIDPLAEEDMIERDLALSEKIGARYHVAHISTARGVDLVRQAKARGAPVTAEVCPHHLLLTDEACRRQDANYKMHPPLRPQEDVQGCLAGVVDGTIDMLVTDHAPHAQHEKARGFLSAPAGIIGLETALALFVSALIDGGHIGWPRLIEMMSTAPARMLKIPGGTLTPGSPADVTIIDPHNRWTIDANQFESKSRNCPFHGMSVSGRAECTLVHGDLRSRAIHGSC